MVPLRRRQGSPKSSGGWYGSSFRVRGAHVSNVTTLRSQNLRTLGMHLEPESLCLSIQAGRVGAVKMGHVRCLWSRPLGHRWEFQTVGKDQYRRCRECGKSKSLGALKDDRPPANMGGGESGGGDWG